MGSLNFLIERSKPKHFLYQSLNGIMRLRAILVVLSTTFLCACIPYPVYKTIQPEAEITVVDRHGKAVQNASASLLASAYPYGHEKSRETKNTGANGKAQFESRGEWRIEVMALHGWEEYFWNWCVRKDGYETFNTFYSNAATFQETVVVSLVPGEAEECPTRVR